MKFRVKLINTKNFTFLGLSTGDLQMASMDCSFTLSTMVLEYPFQTFQISWKGQIQTQHSLVKNYHACKVLVLGVS